MKNVFFFFSIVLSSAVFGQDSEYNTLVNKGLELLIQQNVPAAILKYKQAYKIDSTKVEANYGLGVAYLYDCQNQGVYCFTSLSFLNKAIKIDNSYRNGYFNRGKCKTLIKDYDSALKDYDAAIKQKPNDPQNYLGKFDIYILQGDKEKACKNLKAAVKLNSTIAKNLLTEVQCD